MHGVSENTRCKQIARYVAETFHNHTLCLLDFNTYFRLRYVMSTCDRETGGVQMVRIRMQFRTNNVYCKPLDVSW